MRIAHVTDCFLPRVGGIERQVDGLSSHQAARGDDVEIVTTRLHYARSGRLARAFDPGCYDVVHIHASTVSPLAFLVAARARATSTPMIVTVHSMWTGPVRPGLRLLDGVSGWSRWPVTWSAVSEAAARQVVTHVGDRVVVLPNGVDPRFWAVPQIGPVPGRLRIVSVMRLTGRKRPLALLGVLRALRRDLPPEIEVRVRIIGDGPQRQAVAERVRAWGLSTWVHLDGQLPSEDIRAAFAESDVYVAPARDEAFGIAALEAHSAGLPVVAFARSGVADIVTHAHDGLLVDDDRSMTSALRRLALDPRLTADLRRRACAGPARFDWDTVLDRCDDVYERAHNAPAVRR